jgi:hypothetical protein
MNTLEGIYSIEELEKLLDKKLTAIEDMRRILVEPAIKRSGNKMIELNERQDEIDKLIKELIKPTTSHSPKQT